MEIVSTNLLDLIEELKKENKVLRDENEILRKMSECKIDYVNGWKINTIQPNSVTNARYNYSAVQENVLTCIISSLQGIMSNSTADVLTPSQQDFFRSPYIRIKCDEVAAFDNKTHVWNQLIEMSKKRFTYAYTNALCKNVVVNTPLIGAIRNIDDSNYIDVEININGLPYLLYYGKGVGFTQFNKQIALILKSVYSKRIYKLLKRYEDKGGLNISLEEFKKILGIDKATYSISNLKKKVLEVVKRELSKYADISFEYDIYKDNSASFNRISFKIFGAKTQTSNVEFYSYVYNCLCFVYPDYKSNQARIVCDKLVELDALKKVRDRFKKLLEEVDANTKTFDDVFLLIRHILKTDYGINVNKLTTKEKKEMAKRLKKNTEQVEFSGQKSYRNLKLSRHWENRK